MRLIKSVVILSLALSCTCQCRSDVTLGTVLREVRVLILAVELHKNCDTVLPHLNIREP
jgi:hypothetical protein